MWWHNAPSCHKNKTLQSLGGMHHGVSAGIDDTLHIADTLCPVVVGAGRSRSVVESGESNSLQHK